MDEIRDWLALHRALWSRPNAAWEAVLRAGGVTPLLHAPRKMFCSIPDTDWTVIEQLRAVINWRQADCDASALQKRGIAITPRGGARYPQLLDHIPDPPLLLFWRGQVPTTPAVAIVGSRRATAYGREVVESIVPKLVAAGLTIISGLAYGIDAVAHRATLIARGRTIAVLASGVDEITPHGNQKLGELVMENGMLCSEFPLGFSARAHHFLFRNRIISGLAPATLIVEAELQSGSLVTAAHAAAQGRSVFAVPGPITSAHSTGCNQLLKDGASPCTSADDILDDMFPSRRPRKETADENCGHVKALDDSTSRLLETLSNGPCTANQLGDCLQMPIAQVLQCVTALECAGILKVLPGGHVARN